MDEKLAGKYSMEAMRCLERRLSDIVYRTLLDDALNASKRPNRRHTERRG